MNRYLKIEKWKKLKTNDKWSLGIFILFNFFIVTVLILNMQFFYYDSPTTVWMAKYSKISDLFFKPVTRFYPLTFVIEILTAKIFPNILTIHYLIQYFIFIVGVVLLYYFLKNFIQSISKRIIIVSLLYILTPSTENIFTMYKMEILINTCLIILLYSIYNILFSEPLKKGLIVQYLIYFLFTVCLLLTKETGAILFVPLILLVIYGCIINKKLIKKALSLFLVFTINYGLYIIYRHFYIMQHYSNEFSLSAATFIHNFAWYSYYHFDVLFIGVVGGVLCLIEFLNDKKDNKNFYLLVINITGWGYLFGICLWIWPLCYYIYPAAMLFAISFIIIFIRNISKRILRNTIFLISILLFVFCINYNYKVAVSQIDIGKIYTQSIDDIMNVTSNNDRVLFENYNFYEEPVYQTKRLLQYYNKNINIFGINQLFTSKKMDEKTLSAYGTSIKEYKTLKKEMVPKIGDYIVVYFNQRNFRGSVRGVNPSILYNNGKSMFENQYMLKLVSENSINRKWLQISRNGIIGKAIASYKIYKIVNKKYVLEGLYSDGWSAKEVLIKEYNKKMNTRITLGNMACSWNGENNNTLNFYVNSQLVKSIKINGNKKIIELNKVIGTFKNGDIIKIVVEKTDCPKNYGSKDERELGVQMSFE